jgi:plasmid stability protein
MHGDAYNDADEEDLFMKAITLRNIPPEIAKVVRRRAAEKGQSLNKAVLELVAEGAGLKPRPKKRNTDFDEFFGRWSKKEADAFDRHLREIRKIDPEVWK